MPKLTLGNCYQAFSLGSLMAPLDTDSQFLTPPQAAELLGVGHHKVLFWSNSQELRAIDLSQGRNVRPRWRISRQDLEDFLARRSTSPEPKSSRRRGRRIKSDDHVIPFYK